MTRMRAIALSAALAWLGCAGTGGGMAGVVSGTIVLQTDAVLPEQARIEVQLLDVSRRDSPAIILAEQIFDSDGAQPPFEFELVPEGVFDDSHDYEVHARIEAADQLLFITKRRFPALTHGNPSELEVVVERVPLHTAP
jgi:putative lipoprotein